MTSPNHSTCLIDLSGTSESPTSNMKSLITFPPISADEMIVPLKRFSINNDRSNDPFDTIETQAKLFGDPFEIVNISSRKESSNTIVPTGTLIDVDGSGNSLQMSFDSQNSQDLNRAMCSNSSIATNSSLVDVNSSDTMNRAFLQSNSPSQTQNANRNRILSDPVSSKPKKTVRKTGKARCASLEQICLKKQLQKSLTNSPIGSPIWLKANKTADTLDNSLNQRKSNTVDFNLTNDSIFDDLLSTKPEWIESDNDDSDIEKMTIPFLKTMQDNESTIASNDYSSDRSCTIERLSKYRQAAPEAVADAAQTTETEKTADTAKTAESEKIADASIDKIDKPIEPRPQVDNITSIIETLRNAVKNCADEKKRGEASALLDNLNVCFNTTASNTSTVIGQLEPHKFVRQRTFSVEDQLDDSGSSTPNQTINAMSSSLPVGSAQARKSISGITTTTPRRFSRSMSYAGKPVSVVAAVQIESNSRERHSSVCTTPTRLVKQTSTSNPRSTRTSLGRQSLSSTDEKSVVKPVQRKTIMKTSNPIPSSTVTKPLKLRVGEQTKPSGPLKAVIPYQRSISTPYQRSLTLPNSSDVSTKAKRTVKTSTPLGSNNNSKTGEPAASSTPVFNLSKPPPLSQLRQRHSQSRLSYTPSTPIANPLVRQPSSERKKRSVTFSEETDKLSQSMIVGAKESFPPVHSLQRRRLSQSFGTNKENSVLPKK